MAAPVLRRQRQVDQRLHRSIGAQQRVGEFEQRVRPGGQAIVEVGPELGQHGQGLDAGSIVQQTHLHGLGFDQQRLDSAHDHSMAAVLSGERQNP
ncbi:hypothetical protein OG808_02275 [Streptomyces sp. NBC_01761]|nr:hypothetical protein [Streptomyces sp. NBC_01761]WSC59190.1 hypothetical protein OG808_02275 [Streptomyces sp. NBC_01761]